MAKKDKRKGDSGRPGWAWMADLRTSRDRAVDADVCEPEQIPETSGDGSSAARAGVAMGGSASLDTIVAPLPPVNLEPPLSEDGSSSADELGDETMADIAPVGPTVMGQDPPDASAQPESIAARTQDSSPPASVEHLAAQIRELEARLDEMIAAGGRDAPDLGRGSAPRAVERARRSGGTARELLPQEFYLRQWGRVGWRRRAEEVDEFGHDPTYEARFIPLFDFLYKVYFRVEAVGTENIPAEGRCLIVANHSGGPLPYDGIMLRTTVRREHVAESGAPRELRWLAEDFVYHLPFVGTAMNRLGAVRACQENAERLLAQENLVAVFPEGAKGIGKLFRDRYKLQRFGRGGFIRLCLRTRTPIVPAAIIGAEEANPMLYRVEYMTKALGVPYLPITPTFPALGPIGLLPAPTKWKVRFGEPVDFDAYGPEAADDEILVGRLAERVRGTIQAMLDDALAGRRSIWFG
jgi:1-acyl-sn-glycerol-3-phosphate acyltransferase